MARSVKTPSFCVWCGKKTKDLRFGSCYDCAAKSIARAYRKPAPAPKKSPPKGTRKRR